MHSAKLLTTVTILFLLITLSGCSKENKVSWEYGKSYTFHYSNGDDGIKLLSAIDRSLYGIPQVRVKFELTNEGKEQRKYYRSDFVLEDKNGRIYKPVDEFPGSWELNPLGKAYPQIVYEIPAGLDSYEFNFCYQDDKEIAYRITFNPYDTGFMINHILNMTYNRLINGTDSEFNNKWQMDGYELSSLSTTTSFLLFRDRVKVNREMLNYARKDIGENINATAFVQSRAFNDNNKSVILKGSIEFLQAFEETLKQMGFVLDKAEGNTAYMKKYVKKNEGKNVACNINIADFSNEGSANVYALTIDFAFD